MAISSPGEYRDLHRSTYSNVSPDEVIRSINTAMDEDSRLAWRWEHLSGIERYEYERRLLEEERYFRKRFEEDQRVYVPLSKLKKSKYEIGIDVGDDITPQRPTVGNTTTARADNIRKLFWYRFMQTGKLPFSSSNLVTIK